MVLYEHVPDPLPQGVPLPPRGGDAPQAAAAAAPPQTAPPTPQHPHPPLGGGGAPFRQLPVGVEVEGEGGEHPQFALDLHPTGGPQEGPRVVPLLHHKTLGAHALQPQVEDLPTKLTL